MKRKAMLAALKALNEAKTAKKPDTEIAPLETAYQKALEEWQAEELAGGDSATVVDETTLARLVEKAVTDGLAAKLGEVEKRAVTPDMIAKAVRDAIDAKKGEERNEANIAAVTKAAVEDVLGKVKSATKVRFEGTGTDPGRDPVTASYGWTKGNLYPHAKQLLNVLMKRPMNEGIDAGVLTKAISDGDRMLERFRGRILEGTKALTSTGAGTGDELVPTDLSAELLRRFYMASRIAQLTMANEITMPTQPYIFPLSTTRPTFKLEAVENTAATASDPGTGQVTLNAKKFMGLVEYSYELDEDSIVPILGWLQGLLGETAAAVWESVLINGDDTATHMDTDTAAIAKAPEKAFKGWRKLALAVTELKKDLSTGGINEANLRIMRKAMGKYGLTQTDLLWLVGPLGGADTEAIANVTTIDKYGPRATILTGELSNLFGIPIIKSEMVRENLNATGVQDGVTTTKGSVLLVNWKRFLYGVRRDMMVETDVDKLSQKNQIILSFRRAMSPIEVPSATVPTVTVGYNYTA